MNRNFVGFVGLSVPRFEAHFTPCVEVGWRLAAEHWGRGYATEAARAVTSDARSMIPRPSRSHWTAAPAAKMAPSSA